MQARRTSSCASHTLSMRLAKFRRNAGLTQTQLARAIGVSQRVVAYYEGEFHSPLIDLLPRYANCLGVSVDQLIGSEENDMPENDNDIS